jgi:hypothetical protein
MNQNDANRTSYDALREEIMNLSEEECGEILRIFFPTALNPIGNVGD